MHTISFSLFVDGYGDFSVALCNGSPTFSVFVSVKTTSSLFCAACSYGIMDFAKHTLVFVYFWFRCVCVRDFRYRIRRRYSKNHLLLSVD